LTQSLIFQSIYITEQLNESETLDISNYRIPLYQMLKCRRFTPSGCKDIGIGLFAFVAKTQVFFVLLKLEQRHALKMGFCLIFVLGKKMFSTFLKFILTLSLILIFYIL